MTEAPPPARDKNLSRLAVMLLAAIAASLAMTAGYLLKNQCASPRAWDGFQYERFCYNDIMPLYGRFDGEWRFVPGCAPHEGEPGDDCRARPFSQHGLAYRDMRLEYPPLQGLLISSVNQAVPVNDVNAFFSFNALALALFGVAGAVGVASIASHRGRVFLYALLPPAIFYAFLNWDLFAVGFLVFGIWAFVKERDVLAGALLGLGAATKIFPGFILPALMLARRREGKPFWPLLVYAVIWFAIPNVIVLLYAGADGWWFPFRFQTDRGPNFESFWYFIQHHGSEATGTQGDLFAFWFSAGGGFTKIAQYGSLFLFAAGSLILLWRESRRTVFRPLTAAFGIMILWLLTAKVFSPQFAIWLIPFFALVRVPWHAITAFAVTEFFAQAATWNFLNTGFDALTLLEVASGARYAGLIYLLWWTRRTGEDLVGELEDPRRKPEPAPAAGMWEPSLE